MNEKTSMLRSFAWLVFLPGLIALAVSIPASAQFVEEFVPEDAGIIPVLLRDLTDATIKLAPGVYDMDSQIRFNPNTNLIVEGSGSGLGDDATVLDFMSYSLDELGDGRAVSLRGGAVFRNLTIRNALDRAIDVRTGDIENPSSATVIFENVWFIDCGLGLKSTGGRTAGTAENPALVKHCVFAATSEYPFESVNDPIDVRDTTYISVDHCDFYNQPNLIQLSVNDPAVAPNIGPQVTVENSIFLAEDGVENDDLNLSGGNLTIRNSVVWDAGNAGDIQRTGENIVEENVIVADPMYANVGANLPAANLNFSLKAGSPAEGLGLDGLNAGSVAAQPVCLNDWSVY